MNKKRANQFKDFKIKAGYKNIKILTISFSVIFFGIAPLLNFKPAYDYTIIKDILGAISVLIFGAILFLKKENISIDTIGFITGTLYFGWLLIGYFYAPVKYGAAQALENYLLYYLLFIAGMLWEWNKKDAFIWGLAMVIASITTFIQYPQTHYPISTFGNPNFFAGHLLMPIFLSVYFFKKKYGAVAILYFLITFAALALTKSRAAIFALLVASSFLIFLLLRNHKIKYLKFLGFIVIIVLTLLLWNKIQTQFTQDIRYYIWKGTWNLIKEKPVTGWGTGNFIFYYPYYRFREYFLRPQATPITNHPHCQYLEIWSENGIVGVVFFLLIIVMAFHKGLRKHSQETEEIFLFASSGILAVLIDNILSTNLTNTSTAMYFWFLLGLCFSWNKNSKTIKITGLMKNVLSIVIIVSMLALSVWKTYYRLVPEVYLKNGIAAREANNFLSAIENYKKVCKINKSHVVALYKMAFAYGQIGDLKNAEGVYLKINNELFPHFAKTDANLGTLYMQVGDFKKAIYYYEKALWFNPYDIDVLLGLVSINLYQEKNLADAKKYLERAAQIKPDHPYIEYLIKTFPVFRDIKLKQQEKE
ncbi:MAG: O-antigen ligase family protein [Candidatus Omnitrophica bacterium]|nr:O-antigen ligase family protein [Candidatus Omnitrophota bacterium]